jgi:hypothetical protein
MSFTFPIASSLYTKYSNLKVLKMGNPSLQVDDEMMKLHHGVGPLSLVSSESSSMEDSLGLLK